MYRRKYYADKINNNEQFHQSEKIRISNYQKNRYSNDEDFREKRKQYARDYYLKKKGKLNNSLEVVKDFDDTSKIITIDKNKIITIINLLKSLINSDN